ncbi:MAG: autotransporter domain-containing protein [Chlamydiales bacterium]|nr:autotransporter domain-containing protein [Chlamydiales bacterium]
MNRRSLTLSIATLALLGVYFPTEAAQINWKSLPVNGVLDSSSNWATGVVPGASDQVVFSTSSITNPTTTLNLPVGEFHFTSSAPSYQFSLVGAHASLRFSQAGVTSDPGAVLQRFTVPSGGQIFFSNSASADSSAAGIVDYVIQSGDIQFTDASHAGKATFDLSNSGVVSFHGTASAGEARFNSVNAGQIIFGDSSSAGSSEINVTTSSGSQNNFIQFLENSTAGDATLTLSGNNCLVQFLQSASGGSSSINLNSNASLQILQNNRFGSINSDATSSIQFAHRTLQTGSDNSDATLAGVLNGGNLTKVGTGVLNITGNNPSFEGTVTINDGTLALAGNLGGATGGSFVVNSTGRLRIDQNSTLGSLASDATGSVDFQNFNLQVGGSGSSTTVAGPFVGPGNLTVVGGGRLNVTGNNPTFSGEVTVDGGKLALNGALGGNFSVKSGGVLSGTGAAHGPVVNRGVVSPGNSIGTLSVGSYDAAAGSITMIEVGETTASKVAATNALGTGIVTIENGAELSLIFEQGVIYHPDTVYPIITATNGFTDATHFSTVTGLLPGYITEVNYLPNEVQLALARFHFAEMDPMGDAPEITAVLDELNLPFGSDLSSVIGALQVLNGVDLREALDQMRPALLNALALSQENNNTRVTQAISSRMQELYLTKCTRTCDPVKRVSFWGDLFGDFAKQQAIQKQVGFNANTAGLVTGVDYGCLNNFFVGASAAYTYTDIDWKASRGNGSISSYYADLYTAWFNSFAYANASLLGGFSHYEAFRKIDFSNFHRKAKNNHNGVEYDAHIEGGFLFGFKGIEFRPFDSLDYIYVHERGFSENGASGFNLKLKSKTSNMVRNELGLGIARCFAYQKWSLIPDLKLSWIREVRFKGKHYSVKFKDAGDSFTVSGMKPNRSLFSPALGLSGLFLDKRLIANLRYDAEIQEDYWDQNVNAQLSYAF